MALNLAWATIKPIWSIQSS